MYTVSCTIQLENVSESYRPGEVIKGLVVLNIGSNSSILIKALSLQFTGYAHTKWEKPQKIKKSVEEPNPKIYIKNREDYVDTTSYLIGSEMATPKPIEPGIYNYSFLVNIPQNSPSTFDSPLGCIRYEIKVNADYGERIDTLYTSAIIIEQLKDLRLMDPVQLPTEEEELETISCLKFWQQPLQLKISMPQKSFCAGECIFLQINVTNKARLKLNTIASNLNRIASYKGLLKENISKTTKQITTIASNIYSLYGQNSYIIQHLQQIFIPKTPPTMAFDECKCIALSYELEVLVTCQNRKRWVRTIIPILMGTLSLKSDVKILPVNTNDNNVPSLTVARSMEELTLPSAMDLQESVTAIERTRMSASMSSLASSSFKEAEFMSAVQLNKKSKHQITGDLGDFKPKYLFYDLPEELQFNLQDDTATSNYYTTLWGILASGVSSWSLDSSSPIQGATVLPLFFCTIILYTSTGFPPYPRRGKTI